MEKDVIYKHKQQREEKQKREINIYIYKYPINTFGSKDIKGGYIEYKAKDNIYIN